MARWYVDFQMEETEEVDDSLQKDIIVDSSQKSITVELLNDIFWKMQQEGIPFPEGVFMQTILRMD